MEGIGDFRLAEGPRYDVRTRTLYLVDINGRRLHARPDGGQERSFAFEDHVTSVNLCSDSDKVLVSAGSSLWIVDVHSGRRTRILEMDLGAGMRFNDSALSPSGHLLIGSMRIDRPRVDEGRVYLVSPELEVKEVASGFAVPNGVAFLDDEEFLLVDSGRDVIRRYALSGDGIEERACHFFDKGDSPDGLCLDADGSVMVALWNRGQVVSLDAYSLEENSSRMDGFPIPLSAVGLSDDGRLFVTSGEGAFGPGRLFVLETSMRMKAGTYWRV